MAQVRILLVEDDTTNRKVVSAMLGKLPLKLDVAVNGQEAVDLLRAQHYDLIFMDCQMPVMDGIEATRRLRSGAAGDVNCAVPVVALTADTSPDNRVVCLAAGMNGFLTKPIKLQDLTATVDAFVSGGQPVGQTG